MDSRVLAAVFMVMVVTVVLQVPAGVMGQTQPTAAGSWTQSRTPWGDPDLQGVWNNNTVVPLERPADVADKDTLTEEEVAERFQANSDRLFTAREGNTGFYNEFWFEYGQDTNRTSLVIDPSDGQVPPLTPKAADAQDVLRAHQRQFSDGPSTYLDLNSYNRCISRSLPGAMMPGFYNHNYHFLQTPDYVVLLVEMIHDARIIPLGGRPHPSPKVRQWLGDSRGHWEGDTLVVETTNFNDKGNDRSSTVFGTGENLRLVERFTRVSADTIDYRFTVDDPTTYLDSWTAAIPMNRVDGPIFEYACHEGNYSVPNMLRGARAGEGAAKQD